MIEVNVSMLRRKALTPKRGQVYLSIFIYKDGQEFLKTFRRIGPRKRRQARSTNKLSSEGCRTPRCPPETVYKNLREISHATQRCSQEFAEKRRHHARVGRFIPEQERKIYENKPATKAKTNSGRNPALFDYRMSSTRLLRGPKPMDVYGPIDEISTSWRKKVAWDALRD